MFMKIGPKYKIGKRLGPGIFDKCQTPKFMISEARSQKIRRRSTPKTDYGRQFLEKQKVRFTYGVTERQFRNYIREVLASHSGNPAELLFTFLESRLDNVLYRLGLAASRRAARQLVSHGHVSINEKRVTIPSFRVAPGEIIRIRERSTKTVPFTNLAERLKEHTTPAWLSFDPAVFEGKVNTLPRFEKSELHFDLSPVLEFYSR